MGRQLLQIGRSSDGSPSKAVSIERLVNGYVESAPRGKEPAPIYGTPGLVRFATLGAGPVRGLLEMVERLYGVSGGQIYSINSSGVVTVLGNVLGAGPVDMAGDGTNVVAVNQGLIWVYDGSTVGQVVDPDAPRASSVSWLNGFFIFTEEDAEQFFISPMNAPLGDYDALDFDSSDSRPDKLVRSIVLGKTLLLMGRQSIEFWFYSGDSTFPFERYQDDPLEVGLMGVQAAVKTNDTVFWLASDKTIRRLDGRTATRISTTTTGRIIKRWTNPAATVASAHVHDDHLMIVFRNPEGCIVFDQATERWHERVSHNLPSWRCEAFAYCYDKNLFGSAHDGSLYTLDGEAFDEDGAILPFEMITPFAWAQGVRGSINELEVIMETGVGGLVDQPEIICTRTEDGETWTGEKRRGFGRIGAFVRRVLFGRQGQSRGVAFKFRITDPAKRAILGIYADVDLEV
jgi:hypothetical protein